MAILATKRLTKMFGGLVAIDNLTLDVKESSIHSVIGPNGAGKTTLFNCITGFYKPELGDIDLTGHSLVGLLPDQIVRLGIARTYQNIRLFPNLTAMENILIGLHSHLRARFFGIVLSGPVTRQEEKNAEQESLKLLHFVTLTGRGDSLAKNLPYGEQRRLEIARALATGPKLLLLDEPAAGMNPRESQAMMDFIQHLRDELGVTIILIEHQMKVVMGISETVTVLDYGKKIAEGTPAEIQRNPEVIEAYLGKGGTAKVSGAGAPVREISSRPMLEVDGIHTYYGHIHALRDVTVTVNQGEIVTIIGANGAGKSTMLKTASGLLKPRKGTIRLEDEDITRLRPHQIVMKGVVQVPEGRRIFGSLTVLENLEMGAFTSTHTATNKANLDKAFHLFPRLQERSKQVAGTLSGGEQQMLAMARALMTNPKVLLLDEPSMGLAPVLVDGIFNTIKQLHAAGTTILLVEQNARMALQVASRGYVLQSGTVVLSDSADNLAKNEMVRKAYLGED